MRSLVLACLITSLWTVAAGCGGEAIDPGAVASRKSGLIYQKLGSVKLLTGETATYGSTGGSTTDAPPTCGNGYLDSKYTDPKTGAVTFYYEDCDGSANRKKTCADFGYNAGTLKCNQQLCKYTTSGCFTTTCGDGVVAGSERCEPGKYLSETCTGLGFGGGTLSCSSACTLDTSGCYDVCGDGVKGATETCDGNSLGGQSCTSLGYDAGTLSCTSSCKLDTSACVKKRTVHLYYYSQFDANQVWLHHVSGGAVQSTTLVSSDIVQGGGKAELALQLLPQHDPADEPNVPGYYVFTYVQEKVMLGGTKYYFADPLQTRFFAVGINHLGSWYTLVRETMFIFDHDTYPKNRFEQIYRGNDGKLYAYRPGAQSFYDHPSVGNGPISLDLLCSEGYSVYDLSAL